MWKYIILIRYPWHGRQQTGWPTYKAVPPPPPPSTLTNWSSGQQLVKSLHVTVHVRQLNTRMPRGILPPLVAYMRAYR